MKINKLPSNGLNQLVLPESGGPTKHNLVSFIGKRRCSKSW